MNNSASNIAIIGGGAAGFFAAISAANKQENLLSKQAIYLFESTNNLLSKVLISGGGRCNVTNNTFNPKELIKGYPRGAKELKYPFSQFAVKETVAWFKEQGVELVAEADGRMFPVSNTSETIAQCLIGSAKQLGVKILPKHQVTSISKYNNQYELGFRGDTNQETPKFFKSIVLTTGGSKSSLRLAESLGHQITDLIPSLFSFEIADQRLKDLAGLSFKDISLEITCANKKYKQTGPVLITHWGLSGPAAIKLSAFAAKELFYNDYLAELKINFTAQKNAEQVKLELQDHRNHHLNSMVANYPLYLIPKRYWANLISIISKKENPKWQELSKKEIFHLAEEITMAKFQILGKGKFKDEFVTCGGVSLPEVNLKTMESNISPNLFFAGEVLDIDGITGGYNFQSAWTTGWISGLHC